MPLLECWTALSALARDTRRLRLGTSVLCHSYRSPAVLAKMAATLDVISEGRLDLGLGAGWFEQEYRAYGIPFPRIGERIDQLAEGVEIIRRMWTEAHPRFQGRHYAIDDAVCDPPPLQRPHPPIWIGGEGDWYGSPRAADGVNVWWRLSIVRGRPLEGACRSSRSRRAAALGDRVAHRRRRRIAGAAAWRGSGHPGHRPHRGTPPSAWPAPAVHRACHFLLPSRRGGELSPSWRVARCSAVRDELARVRAQGEAMSDTKPSALADRSSIRQPDIVAGRAS
jgi:alkanesulfonate monooxygenase SsuD/methylene tetrahydromethanopterin reductase-like flavin-dependent oxidoreductase (luciferase family)